ncbi:hypothetical protein SMU26_10163, partial [Streptococcus mutans 3SN1]
MSRINKTESGIPTLDTSNLSYQVERVRINYPNMNSTSKLLKTVTEDSGKTVPANLTYVSDFYD